MLGDQGIDGNQQFITGTPIYDSVGEMVGTLIEVNVQSQVLVVDKGPFRTENLYVPLNTVQRSDANAIDLSVGKDELLNA